MKTDSSKPSLTTGKTAKKKGAITDALIDDVCLRLAKNHRVRRNLPNHGRLHIDRQLPFLCVYRRPVDRDDLGTERLVKGEASYLVAPADTKWRKGVAKLVQAIARTQSEQFGAFLILEVWSASDGGKANDPAVPTVLPTFHVFAPQTSSISKTVDALTARLRKIKILKQGVDVEIHRGKAFQTPGLRPLLLASEARELNVTFLGLEVPPVYRRTRTGEEFPTILRALRRNVGLAMRRAFFQFSRSHTTHQPAHYHSLGRRAVVKSVWNVDQQLAEVSNAFDYLLQLTPVNATSAWKEFRRSDFERMPAFHYRPLPIDPSLLKRKLFNIPLERVEDPALHELYRQKQDELERKITMLGDRDSPRFLHGSLQLFGAIEGSLLKLSHEILRSVPAGVPRDAERGSLTPEQFAERVRQELAHYHAIYPGFAAKAVISKEVSGLIVSRGRLMISSDTNIARSRVDALLAHEVGTHLLTYYNGRAQPFRQLASGLAGYEELQEGLAVLSEYLVGGLSRTRMRQLAARVVAAQMRTDGASFVDTFRKLDRDHAFAQRPAFNIAMRVFRGGGLTKDIVYLRGLCRMLKYIQEGGELDPLFVGKLAAEHIPIIRELRFRQVLVPPPITPRYLETQQATERLARLRGGNHTVLDLIDPPIKKS